ncbi:MAG: hypothetical protein G01um10148_11 [Parcubacteria group bacterium Gr01-1014_8]|nr:MAG: hypothetical protein G01um10148_11 [Parcubacteria group bacterium Gr01-1014_8]
MKDDSITLELTRQACGKVTEFLGAISEEEFYADAKTQSAIIMQLIVIGELAKNVSQVARSAIDVPWKQIAGLRDVAIHQYFGLKLKEVWRVIKDDVPMVQDKISAYLAVSK